MPHYGLYAPYVWTCYAVTAVVMGVLIVWAVKSGPKS